MLTVLQGGLSLFLSKLILTTLLIRIRPAFAMNWYVSLTSFNFKCHPRGKAVSKLTTKNHRRQANATLVINGCAGDLGFGPQISYAPSVLDEYADIINTAIQNENDGEQLEWYGEDMLLEDGSIQLSESRSNYLSYAHVSLQVESEIVSAVFVGGGVALEDVSKHISSPCSEREDQQYPFVDISFPFEVFDSIGVEITAGHRMSSQEDTLPSPIVTEDEGTTDFSRWAWRHRRWVDIIFQHGLTLTAMDDILGLLKSLYKSWKTILSNICYESAIGD